MDKETRELINIYMDYRLEVGGINEAACVVAEAITAVVIENLQNYIEEAADDNSRIFSKSLMRAINDHITDTKNKSCTSLVDDMIEDQLEDQD